MPKLNSFKKKKILIVTNRLIGDNIAAFNAVFSLFYFYKEKGAVFHVLGYPYCIEIYHKINPQKIFFLNDLKDFNQQNKISFFKLALKLRKERYDIAFILPGGFFFAFLTFFSGIKKRVGHQGDFCRFFLTHSIPLSQQIPNFNNYDNLLKELNVPTLLKQPSLPCAKIDFKQKKIKGKYVIISPFASESNKVWSPFNFKRLAKQIRKRYKTQIIFIGLKSEKEKIVGLKSLHDLDLVGELSLLEVFYLIKKCFFFIGNDSGLAHVAGQWGVPTFVIMGPSNFLLSQPRGEKTHLIYQIEPAIKPADRKKAKYQRQVNIDKVVVDQVYQKIINELMI